MKKSVFLLSILIILFSWDCNPNWVTPTVQRICIPENRLINYEEKFEIRWDYSEQSKVTISLIKDDAVVTTIAENVDNQDFFAWTPGADLVGAGYMLRMEALTRYDEILAYAISLPFRITNPNWEDLGYVNTPTEKNPWGPVIDIGKDGMPLVLFNHLAVTPMPGDEIDKWKNRLHLKKWNGTGWTDMGYLSKYQSNYYSLASRSDGAPVVFYTEGVNNGTHFAQWQPGMGTEDAWDRSAPALIPSKSDEQTLFDFSYALGLSLALDSNNNPMIAHYFIDNKKESYESPEEGGFEIPLKINFNIVLRVSHLQENEWVAYGDDGDQVGDLSFSKQIILAVISARANNEDVELPYFTSLVFDGNDKPYVAISDYNSNGAIRVFTMEGNSWQLMESGQNNDFEDSDGATSPQLVTDSRNRPIIAYYQTVSKEIVVRRWDGSRWEDLNYPAYSGDIVNSDRIKSRVSIAVTGNNQLVVASEDGVKMHNGTEWVNLGYPNFPCGGTGYWNGWLAAGDSEIALVYQEKERDRADGNAIKAALLKLP